jgi:hypothetical protein
MQRIARSGYLSNTHLLSSEIMESAFVKTTKLQASSNDLFNRHYRGFALHDFPDRYTSGFVGCRLFFCRPATY